MSRFLASCAVVALAASASAQEKLKPNKLTPTEIAEGWLLLFDGESKFGWASDHVGGKADLAVKDGTLTFSGKGSIIRCTTEFQYFELRGEYRSKGDNTRLSIELGQLHSEKQAGFEDTLAHSETDEWRSFVVKRDVEGIAFRPNAPPSRIGKNGESIAQDLVSRIDFLILGAEDSRLELRSLKLRPLEMKPLFDGKSLEGWSVNQSDPKRVASKWAVTRDGELSLKNGPGDLVSDKQFDNFVLQVECKSLGKNLNSGVFFRNIPGQYQNGYEAQIHNGYKDDDRTKPLDFGTGAIYRRVPARKVVSNDNEWFTMTVVAEGKHIATWVNGYQTVDWTDTRPAAENPRTGYRAAKGPLSLQGHDVTTDLLFRNIRIAELPVEKK